MFKTTKFTQFEYDYIITHANFTERELFIFRERNKDYPMTIECIAEKWESSVDTVKAVVRNMKEKVRRVLDEYCKR